MNTSQFLAKFFGYYFILISIVIAIRPAHFKTVVNSYFENAPLVMLSGIITLLFGLFLVMIHTMIVPDWRLLVTILCWVVLIKGWCLLVYPKWGASMSKRMMARKHRLTYAIVGYILLGLLLLFFSCCNHVSG
jgi:hypothetical protein